MEGSSIFYGSSASSGGGGVPIAGARNGTSLDASDFVVLGETVGDPLTPAKLTSTREIPLEGFSIDWFGGPSIFSNDSEPDLDGSLVQVVRNNLTTTIDMGGLLLVNKTPATIIEQEQNTPSIRMQGQGFVSGSATSGTGEWIMYGNMQAGDPNIESVWNLTFRDNLGTETNFITVNTFGDVALDTLDSLILVTRGGIRFNDISNDFFDLGNNQGSTGDGTLYLRGTTPPFTTGTAFASANTDDGGGNSEYYKLGWNNTPNMVIFSVEAQGTGIVRPVAFLPNIRFGDNTAPTAIIDIAPGGIATGTGPIKLSAGGPLTVAEPGVLETDSTRTHLFWTDGAGTRHTIV